MSAYDEASRDKECTFCTHHLFRRGLLLVLLLLRIAVPALRTVPTRGTSIPCLRAGAVPAVVTTLLLLLLLLGILLVTAIGVVALDVDWGRAAGGRVVGGRRGLGLGWTQRMRPCCDCGLDAGVYVEPVGL
jgi:hypothetical protein